MEQTPPPPAVYPYALMLLSRREYSKAELKQKLLRRFGADAKALIEATLERLAQDDYQSDQRFTESFINSRLHRGYGLNRIKLELRQKGIDQEGISHMIKDENIQAKEQQQLERMWRKKFNTQPKNSQERYQQQCHLANKGFRKELIEQFFRSSTWDDE
ncbi:MAG TPA: regulatory protein RecX [Marinagarivorans sp.]|nr:regulatory protein RecX [Cellvibrionaceae bacterium]HMY38512.1 regulatory protein RecX [Marinagarivorans sp.]HNG60240.1 regulatory protein RecX [Cellvibrionaceae bacterium]